MPKIEIWSRLPPAVRDHLVEQMRDRKISSCAKAQPAISIIDSKIEFNNFARLSFTGPNLATFIAAIPSALIH